MRTVYIILSTVNIGGAEKRFTGLWRSFQNDTDLKVNLVMNPQLHRLLVDLNEIDIDNKSVIITKLQGTDFRTYRKNVISFIEKFTTINDIIHFIGISPLINLLNRKVVFSVTGSNLSISGRNNKLIILLSSLLANTVDVLDPRVFKQMCSIFFWKKKKILRTSNSYCDTDLFKPAPFIKKKNWIVFLGRFVPVKQIEQIIKALPLMYQDLKNVGISEVHFYLLGYGEFTFEINSYLNSEVYKTLPLTIKFEKEPYKILNKSKVFLSLQLHNNYPSKSLLEAMAAGNIPLVTDVGQTRWIAKPEFSYYVPERFSNQELSKAIVDIFSLNESEWQLKIKAARDLVVNNHTIDKMKTYYKEIYNAI